MTNPSQSRADAIRAALIEQVGHDLHGSKPRLANARHQAQPAPRRLEKASWSNDRWGRWAAASVAVVLVAGVAGAGLLIASNARQPAGTNEVAGTPLPASTAQSPEATAPPVGGDAALWQLIDAESVNADSTILKLAVTRISCAGGETGVVLEPRITYEPTRVVIEVDVEPLAVGMAYSCPGNNAVPITVELTEPIGERSLVDGGCSEFADAANTVCADPTRWK